MLDKTKEDWWKSAVFYQVYPKSFQDANGDGIPGIIQHLDYLETLGIDGIWLSPVHASPQRDNGYDISDYQGIHPPFGAMEDMERLIAEAEKRGITIIMDLVLNHSSGQHHWFLSAKADKDSPWQPDLNWENPAMRREGQPEDVMEGIYAHGRDNARTPMQWTDGTNAGFSQARPRLPVNPNHTKINAQAALASPDSVFYFYQRLSAPRKRYPVFREGDFTLLNPGDEAVFACTRDAGAEHLLVVCNFTAEEQPEVCPEGFRGGRMPAANYADPSGPLRPYETRMLYVAA